MAEATIADGDVEYAATTGADSKVTLDPPRSPPPPLALEGGARVAPWTLASPLALLAADTSCAA